MKKSRRDTCIAVSSVLIALAALLLAVYEGSQARRHDRLSVRPELAIERHKSQHMPQAGLILSNNGFGPAIIDTIILRIDGRDYSLQTQTQGASVINELGLNTPWITWATIGAGYAIPQGEKKLLVGALKTNFSPERLEVIRNALSKITIIIRYHSLYDEKFVLISQRRQ